MKNNLSNFDFLYDSDRKPIRFWPYTSIVTNRIFSSNYDSSDELNDLHNCLIRFFRNMGIKACLDNKTVFEFDLNGISLFVGFKDWTFSVGLSVYHDSWIKPFEVGSLKKEEMK